MARRVARHPFVPLGLVALVGAVACAQAEPVNEEVIDSGVGDVALGGAAGADASTGGSSGAGGSSTTDAGDAAPSACQCDEPSCGVCPATQIVAAGGYGIFAQEVTNEAYQAWLDTQPNPQLQGGECAWNTSYVPAQGWPATDAKLPVNYVDFCDAAAYCRWAKRRLCGKIGGGANVYGDFASATKSQWHNACSAGAARRIRTARPIHPLLATAQTTVRRVRSRWAMPRAARVDIRAARHERQRVGMGRFVQRECGRR